MRHDGFAPLAPSDIPYGWHVEQYNPYVCERIAQSDFECNSAGQAISEVKGLLNLMAESGWYIVPINHYTWSCTTVEDGFAVVKRVTLELGSAAPN